jgi:hypothetical protein
VIDRSRTSLADLQEGLPRAASISPRRQGDALPGGRQFRTAAIASFDASRIGDGLRTLEDRAFLLLIVAVSVAFAWILWPFYGAVLWATILAIVFAPSRSSKAQSFRFLTTAAMAPPICYDGSRNSATSSLTACGYQ